MPGRDDDCRTIENNYEGRQYNWCFPGEMRKVWQKNLLLNFSLMLFVRNCLHVRRKTTGFCATVRHRHACRVRQNKATDVRNATMMSACRTMQPRQNTMREGRISNTGAAHSLVWYTGTCLPSCSPVRCGRVQQCGPVCWISY